MRTLLDTNCILRYLLSDIPDQAEVVAKTVEQGACTAPEFLAECVYVLGGSVYGFSRDEVAGALLALLDEIDCEHMPVVREALAVYRSTSFDFADCILLARHRVEQIPVMTFGRKLRKAVEDEG